MNNDLYITGKYKIKLVDLISLPRYSSDIYFMRKHETSKEDYKIKYPGNYDIEEYYEPIISEISLRLRFHTEADKTMFILRYS